ncbi:MAG: glycosyltransferase family 2 protein [Bacteroidetes bacterium]|nr:glycosyltransferase family 2 protein [Bacteroidota bacterium]
MTEAQIPAITVLMPVYNAAAFVGEAIESILCQTFTDFEFLIINDGSTDDSEKIIFGYQDSRIRYIKNESNLRLIATLNKGIELARGKYIARMDADDISLLERLQIQFDFMERHPEVVLCGSWYEAVGLKSQLVKYVGGHQQIMLKMLYQCHLCHPTVVFRKKVVDSFQQKFDRSYLHAEDYEFFTRIGETHQLDNIQQVLLKYRHHVSSVSSSNRQIQFDNSTRIKKHLFSRLGMRVSNRQLEVFRKIAEHNYEKSMDFVVESRELLEDMFQGNERSCFFDSIFFKRAMASYWFHVCYNSTNMGFPVIQAYSNSVIRQYFNPGWLYKFKFFIKALFKI